MKSFLLTAALAVLTATSASAQIDKPIRYTWIVSSCETWNCAAAALVLANGDKNVLALPTGDEERPWLILKRVEEGSIFIPDDEPFACEVFDHFDDASLHFHGLEDCHYPMIMNTGDGRAVVMSMRNCKGATKRRAVR